MGKLKQYYQIVRLVVSIIRHSIFYIVRNLKGIFSSPKTHLKKVDQSVDSTYQNFLKINYSVWENFLEDIKDIKKGYILIDGRVNHPGYLMTNIIVANYIRKNTQLYPLAFLTGRKEKKISNFFMSYGVKDFFHLNANKSNLICILKSFLTLVKLASTLKRTDDILKLKIDGISIGYLLYDEYLKQTGNGTIKTITFNFYWVTFWALRCYYHFDRLFKKKNISIVVQPEINYVVGGLLSRVALKHGAVIYSPWYWRYGIAVRKYDDPKSIHTYQARPSKKLYDYFYKNHKNEAIKAAEEFLQQRFSGEDEDKDAVLAFSKTKRVLSKLEICKMFGWSINVPIVCIMSHVFVDAPHCNNWMLFRDFLTWYQLTLKAIHSIDHVNWLIKAHPSEKYYFCRETTESEYQILAGDCSHVKILPDDVNSKSLLSTVQAIVTVSGTAGLEFSCFGIPCILSGESSYSGFGFTTEPQSQKDYFELLKNIHKVRPLDNHQIEKAKLFAYLYFILFWVHCNLIPAMSTHNDFEEECVWKEATDMIINHKPSDEKLFHLVQAQMAGNHTRLVNWDF
ncbi:MAG: hypothetical protein AB1401_04795 [Thermodesulfobacteriota bacterium]